MRRRIPQILTFLLLFFGITIALRAQDAEEPYVIQIKQANSKITLDGELNEIDWQQADWVTDFFQTFPFDSSFAKVQTKAALTYDENFVYIAAVCYDPEPGNYIIQSLKRDFSYPITDAFAVYIDPFSDKTNGFNFTVSPLGVQREGLVENGGSFGVTTAWDNKWFSEVQQFEDRWEVEMAIPFKTLRYKKGKDVWRINFSRNNLKANENSSWVPVPRNMNIATLAFTGQLRWDVAPKKTGANIALIPYALGGLTSTREPDTNGVYKGQPMETTGRWNVGGDAKITVTPSLNLDLTFNPDFSQVEVDRQVTNLDRFELFFPERRQFFIENSDLFGQFGFRQIRPFFSRRIGLSSGGQVPILAGARLSGKLNSNLRLGVMNMQTAAVDELNLESQNYTVVALQQQVFNRSNVSGIFVNRQGFDGTKLSNQDYNRVAGLDYNIASKNNRVRGKVFYHHSWDDETTKKKGAQAVWLMYNDPKITVMYNHEWVQKNYNAETGFVRRFGYFRLEPMVWYRFYPKKGKIVNNHGPEYYYSQYWNDSSWVNNERENRVGYQVTFQNRINLSASVTEQYILLTFPFDPTRTGIGTLPEGTGYNMLRGNVSFSSDFRKKFTYSLEGSYGTYFGGRRLGISGNVSYRIQPWAILSLTVDQNNISNIQYPDTLAKNVPLTLVSPRFEFSFSRSLFFTTFLQYNTQTQNFNINSRFQWRFKPMSDLFVVLTENIGTSDFVERNRALVVKLNYWFSL